MGLNQRLYFGAPVPVQNLLVSAYGYYLRAKRRGGRDAAAVRARVAEVRHWTPDRVAAYQAARLEKILDVCRSVVPYYESSFRRAGVGNRAVTSAADLAALPILTKEEVRRSGDALRRPGARPYWLQHTSGSTGTPVVVAVNRETYQLVHALLSQHEHDCGVGEDDLRATFAGRLVQPVEDLAPPFWRYNRADRQVLFSAYHLAPATLPAYAAELVRRQPAEILGYPSAIATVAAFLEANRERWQVRPRVVITNSETLLAWQRRPIEEAFQCPVRDYYGSAESVVFAAQCAHGTYHFDPLLGVAEIVDGTGQPVRAGERGRLLCTTLVNDTMPLVRYEIGDEAVRAPRGCPCGNPWDGASEILGRQDEVIHTPDGRAVGRVDHIFKGVHGLQECQVVQETLDRVILRVVIDDDFGPAAEKQLRENARLRLGDDVRVDLEPVTSIPRNAAGKFRGVVSRLER